MKTINRWLVELFKDYGTGNSTLRYYTGIIDTNGQACTTTNAYGAIWYKKKEYAEQAIAELRCAPGLTWRAVRHSFADPFAGPETESKLLQRWYLKRVDGVEVNGLATYTLHMTKPEGHDDKYDWTFINLKDILPNLS